MRTYDRHAVSALPALRDHSWPPTLLLCLGCALTLAIAGCGQAPGGLGASPTPTLTQKEALLATVAAQETIAANGSRAPKQTSVPITPPTSCPMPTPQPGIYAPSLPTQGYNDASVDNSTAVIPSDHAQFEYAILAGARKSNPQQGLLIVIQLVVDPCAAQTPSNSMGLLTYYNTPYQQGHVQLTGVSGDTVTFTTASGGGTIRHFNFVTGQFS